MEAVQSSPIYKQLDRKLHRKSTRRRLVRYSILGVNALLLFGILAFVLLGQQSGSANPQQAVLSASQSNSVQANPLDQVSAADIAVNIARMDALPESTSVVNQADSVNTELALTPASTSIVAKPQVVVTALKSRKDIQTYVAAAGDTVTTLATKFGVTSDSIRWSNNLNGNTITTGSSLVIPPGPAGIVYTVKAGDTADTLAAKFKASKEEVIASNDAEISGLKVGERILIPNGTQPAPVVQVAASVSSSASAGFGWGAAPVYGFNGYDYGYCTWYVANKVSVPANWGNANTWDNRAAMSGWIVSSIPKVGAIAQTDRGSLGHVAYVEAVSEDGSQIKYSDMNGLAGWGHVGYSDWIGSSAKFEHYIYR